MNLNLTWDNTIPLPDCGFRADYRRKGEQVAYSHITTSGSTSATTSIHIPIIAPANYEGAVYGNCCSGSTSAGDPYAVNAYSVVTVSVVVLATPDRLRATITSLYANPYDVIFSVYASYTLNGTPHTVTTDITLVNGTTNVSANLISTTGTLVLLSYTIIAISPIFDNGGELQQYDPVSTPSYFQLLPSGTTVPNTSGSPITLPSFTLDSFQVTEVDSSNNPTAGNLLISWGQEIIYANGVNPYDNFTFTIKDASGSTLGTATIANNTKGLRELTIPIQKATIPLTTTNILAMRVLWDDGSTIGSAKAFYLPDFTY